MSQQRCIELEGKLQTQQQQHRLSMQTSPANMIEATRAKAIADLEQVPLLTEMAAAVFVAARTHFVSRRIVLLVLLLSAAERLSSRAAAASASAACSSSPSSRRFWTAAP